ncbi:MAG: peptidase S41 [Bacteroides sp.]|nr:peptidase S41 [Bacteroides sp.]
MKRKLMTVAAFCALGLSASAITPLWLRDVKISPDGSEIAFTYKGDIYMVSSKGGNAVRLTTQPSYESNPVWSPDGKQIAFASDRNGGRDVYVMSSKGGSAKRLTFNSANETPEAFTPDGKSVVFSASIQDPASSAIFPTGRLSELYVVSLDGGRPQQILATPALSVSYLPDGKSFVYQDIKGMEDEWRKHHTSSVTRDIWRYDAASGKHINLTQRGGEDLNPVVATDGKTVYFLSERNGGSMNVYSMSATNGGDLKQLTDFTVNPVRFLSQGSNGLMAFAYDGEIYTLQPGAGAPQKVAIDLTLDDEDLTERIRVSSPNEAAVSKDGKQVAFTSRGEVFVTSVEYPSTKQITFTPQGESDVIWGKDNRELYYTSERDGHYNIYRANIARKDDPNFSNATLIEETAVFPNDGVDRTVPSLSPDGKKLAYIEDRNKLMVMDLATKKVTQLTDGTTQASRSKGFTANWSPDSKWIAINYCEPAHEPYSDIALIEVSTGKLTKVTETGYFDADPRWVLDGKAILFLSERYGMRSHASWGSQYDVMLTFLTQDAYDRYRLSEEDYALLKEVEKESKKAKAKDGDDKKSDKKGKKSDKKSKKKDEAKEEPKEEPVQFDLTDLADRTVRLTPNSSNIADAILSKDGEKLYYLSAFEGGYDLWEVDLRKGDASIANKLNGGAMAMELDDDGNIFLLGRQMKKFDPKSSRVKNISASATMELDPAAEREYMFNFVRNEEKERFFRKDMNGADWDALCNNYAKFLPHINNNYDFAEMLSELLGELNVSHTGSRYFAAGADAPTASLGLLYDMTFAGPGLKVDEVVAKGPFDRAGSAMKPGAVITAINGVELTADSDPLAQLNSTRNKKTLVSFTDAQGKKHDEVVLPISAGAFNSLLYNRWLHQRQADVERLSGGRLGYVHIPSMDDESFRKIYADLLGKYVNKEGIVIDTRWNGGGRLHEDIEVLFSGDTYLTQEVHGQTTSVMPSRRWNKPSIMIIGEANYSNAHGTPWVYKHKGLGKLVGMPVPGTMSSVNWVYLQDPTMLFGIPVTGFVTAEGNYLENTQLEPDVRVANDPAVIITGEDQQLRKAVEELLKEIDNK